MNRLVFATNNKHKFEEIKNKVSNKIELLSLNDIRFFDEIPETKDSIEGNALEKAWHIYNKFGMACFADDTGLEVEALNGAPGVYSARYAGEKATYQDNVNKLLAELKDNANRKARFVTCIALIEEGVEKVFMGEVSGIITNEAIGENGFGYDPVFLPDGYQETFAQMSMEIKNSISHRARATEKLVGYLNQNF